MMGVIGVMGDAVAIGDLACITSYERWEGGVWGTREQERERERSGAGGGREEKGRGRALRKKAGSINDINEQYLRPPDQQ